MTAAFDLVTIDTPDVDRASAFWCAALDLHEVEREDVDRWVVLADHAGVRRVGLQRGVARPGGVHLDLTCRTDEFDATLGHVVDLGARVDGDVRREPYGVIANLRDPDGYAFDLCAYT